MRWFLNLLIAVSTAVIAFSLGFLIYYKLTFTPSWSFSPKESSAQKTVMESTKNVETANREGVSEGVPEEVLSQVENLSSVVNSFIVKVNNGISTYPALLFKVAPSDKGLKVYLLTFYPMEWPFVKVSLMGEKLGAPSEVLQCEGNLILLVYPVRGIFPVEVERGNVGEFGAIAVKVGNSVAVNLYSSKKGCTENGFVFNLSGDFSGVCFGGNFYSAEELYSSIPENCRVIYEKEGENGNLQGKN